jgi:hypothetical protein
MIENPSSNLNRIPPMSLYESEDDYSMPTNGVEVPDDEDNMPLSSLKMSEELEKVGKVNGEIDCDDGA